MKLILAKTAGFCMGVRRAVELALAAPARHQEPIYTYGPLIHNPQVLDLLAEKGISILETIPAKGCGTVLIRAHGVPPETKRRLEEAGFTVVDATCPRVIRVQTIIRKHAARGHDVIILGDPDHPEVVGLKGCAGERGHVVASLDSLKDLQGFEKAILVAQTTQNTRLFDDACRWVEGEHPHYKLFNTICDSTEKRQAEVQEMAAGVDAIVVVGGKESGNTQRLAEIGQRCGIPTCHVETETELDPELLAGVHRIGITAGASTPNWIIKKIFRSLESLPLRRGHRLRRMVFNLQRALLLTNIYAALGAGALCLACTRLLGIDHGEPYVSIAALYVLSMHTLNHLTGTRFDHYNEPERAAFYRRNKRLLTLLALVAGASGLMAAFSTGKLPFMILLLMSVTGLSYNRTLPAFRRIGGRYRKIRDLPGSKTILITLAWGVVTALVPQLAEYATVGLTGVFVFLLSLGMVFARTAFFDVLDIQGDRIFGKETIPVLVGRKAAIRMLKIVLGVILAALPAGALGGLIPLWGLALCICPLYLLGTIAAYEKEAVLPGINLEFRVETSFIVAGAGVLLTMACC